MKQSGGFILLSKRITESEIFIKPPLYLKIWIYLLTKANYTEEKSLKRGQVLVTIRELQDACSYYAGYRKEMPTKSQIFNVLEWLRNPCGGGDGNNTSDTMITTAKTTRGIIVTIDKYSVYQDFKTYEQNSGGTFGKEMGTTTTKQQSDTIQKELKEYKEELKDNVATPSDDDLKFQPDSFEIMCVDKIINACCESCPGSKVPKSLKEKQAWAIEFDRMVRIDKRSKESIVAVLEFALSDEFWKSNIRSGGKFRKQYETLYARMSAKKNNPKPQAKGTKFSNFPQREYDFNDMERRLLMNDTTV